MIGERSAVPICFFRSAWKVSSRRTRNQPWKPERTTVLENIDRHAVPSAAIDVEIFTSRRDPFTPGPSAAAGAKLRVDDVMWVKCMLKNLKDAEPGIIHVEIEFGDAVERFARA